MRRSGAHNFPAIDRVIYGKAASEAVSEEAERLKAKRVFLIVSRTLNTKTDEIEKIRRTLGDKHAATFDGIAQHTTRRQAATAAQEARLAWLGGSVAEWSPEQRAHWASEQALQWSGLPGVNIRATMFAENPILSWFPLKQLLSADELHLPFGTQKIAPIAAYDVAEICAKILIDPSPHISMSYALTGPELKDMHGFAEDYGAALGRKISYVPQDLDAWIETYINSALASRNPHTADHLKTITRLVAGGRYDVVNDELERSLGRAPKTVQWALERNPRIRKSVEAA